VRLGVPFRWGAVTGPVQPYFRADGFFEAPGAPVLGAGLALGLEAALPVEKLMLDAQVRGESRLSFSEPRLTLTGTLGIAARW
jgi:hypothetical protein